MSLDKLRELIDAYNPALSQWTDESVKAHHDLALLAHYLLLPAMEALKVLLDGGYCDQVRGEEWDHEPPQEDCETCQGRAVLAQLEEALA